jgi:metallo-beta-lactamase class B
MRSLPLLTLLALTLVAPAGAASPAPQQLSPDLSVVELAPGVWLHTSWADVPGFGRVPANGLVVVGEGEAAMVNTPWDDALTARLMDWMSSSLGVRTTTVIPTHSHDDNLGGLAEAHRRGARSIAMEATRDLAKAGGKPVPLQGFVGLTTVTIGGRTVSLRFPGGGHTRDNIVVWLPDAGVLFGGCLVKAVEATGLGYTREAVLDEWPTTIRTVMDLYPEVRTVVPGHGSPGGAELLTHTLDLLRTAATPAAPPK